MTTTLDICWQRAAPRPLQAIVLLDHETQADTIIVAHQGADGLLYGCRDIVRGPKQEEIICAWLEDATASGLKVDDRRSSQDEQRLALSGFAAGRPYVFTDLSGARRIALYKRSWGGPSSQTPPHLSIMSTDLAVLTRLPMSENEALSFFIALPDAERLPAEGCIA